MEADLLRITSWRGLVCHSQLGSSAPSEGAALPSLTAAPTPLFLPVAASCTRHREQKLLLLCWEMLTLANSVDVNDLCWVKTN